MTPCWLELLGGRHPYNGAKAKWRAAVAPLAIPGCSRVRWYSLPEIQFLVLAAFFDQLQPFLSKLDAAKIGDANRKNLNILVDDSPATCFLKLHLAAVIGMRVLASTDCIRAEGGSPRTSSGERPHARLGLTAQARG